MTMSNLIQYSDIYSKTWRSLRQYYRDEVALSDNKNIVDFRYNNNNSIIFIVKEQITGKTGNRGTQMLR